MTFNEKIDKYMKDNNIPNLKKFANLANIPYTTLHDFYEKKSADNSRLSTIRKLSSFMNCSMDYLAFDEIENINEIKINGYDINEKNDNKKGNNKVYEVKFSLNSSEQDLNWFIELLKNHNIKYEFLKGNEDYKQKLKEKGIMDQNENINEENLNKILKIADMIDNINK